jgi:hypothetical protein
MVVSARACRLQRYRGRSITPGLSGLDIGAHYTDDEREFLIMIDRYKRLYRRPHPTWRQVLDVLKGLGWRKVGEESPAASSTRQATI